MTGLGTGITALTGASQCAIISDVLKIPYGDGKLLSFQAVPVEAVPQIHLRPFPGVSWFLASINNQALIPGSLITAQFFVNSAAVSGSVSGLAGRNNYNAASNPVFVVTPPAEQSPVSLLVNRQLYLKAMGNNNVVQGSEPTAYFASNGLLTGYIGYNPGSHAVTITSAQILIAKHR